VRDARVIVDGDEGVFPAGPSVPASVSRDAMADPVDTAQLLDVEVDQVAGIPRFVTLNNLLFLVHRPQCPKSFLSQRPGYRGPGNADRLADRGRGQTETAHGKDECFQLLRNP
jgi:hypothetical protein